MTLAPGVLFSQVKLSEKSSWVEKGHQGKIGTIVGVGISHADGCEPSFLFLVDLGNEFVTLWPGDFTKCSSSVITKDS